MVAHGTPCLGPVTHAGCGALCPSYDRGCYGCYGPKETPNAPSLSRATRRARHGRAHAAARLSHLQCRCRGVPQGERAPWRVRRSRSTISPASRAKVGSRSWCATAWCRARKLSIFEPPRFFEAFLRGRAFSEAPDITARICGICPVAYQMSAVHAMENALGVTVVGPVRDLRRLLYCGEWIESHTLHIYMLHAPDFLGYAGAIDMARDHGEAVRRGLALKKAGNEIMTLLGGREIHPINVRVGGFYRMPRRRELEPLAERLKWARDAALETVRWTAGFDFPDRERDYVFVALRHAEEYPFNEGRIVSNRGLDIAASEYDETFRGNPCRALDGLALANARRRLLSRRAARPLQPEFRPPVAARAGGRARGGARSNLHQPLPQHRRPRGRGALCLRRSAANHRGLRGAGAACRRGRAAGRHRLRRHRGAARAALSPLSAGSGRDHRRGAHRAADLAEPGEHRGGS